MKPSIFDFDRYALNHAKTMPKLMGGEPDPGAIGNIKVKSVNYARIDDIVEVSFIIPRYCALDNNENPYFTVGQKYAATFIAEYPIHGDSD